MAKKPARRPPSRTRSARLLSPVQDFIRTESASGVVLIAAALVAFAWANSPWAAQYFAILDIRFGVGFGAWGLEKPLLLWVNDLLMAMFFFLVGLEIKRECVVGELAGWNKAALPVAGALGGMVVPALIFVAFNHGLPSLSGWGVPMATDIAFALGILALLGDRVPPGPEGVPAGAGDRRRPGRGAGDRAVLHPRSEHRRAAAVVPGLGRCAGLRPLRARQGAGVRPDRPGDVVFHAEIGRARHDCRRADGPGGAAAPQVEPAAATAGATPAHGRRTAASSRSRW